MGNMGYCRFQNTSGDVQDCITALEDGKTLSVEEHRAAQDMFGTIIDYLTSIDAIDDGDEAFAAVVDALAALADDPDGLEV